MRKFHLSFLVLGILSFPAWAIPTGTVGNVWRVPSGSVYPSLGSIDLSLSATVGSSVLGQPNGGTGFSTYTAGDLPYSSATNVLSKLGIGNLGQKLGTASGLPAWIWDEPNIQTKTTTYTALSSDNIILASGSAFTITLPSAIGLTGKKYTIIKTDSTIANIITLATTSAQTIAGSSTTTLNTQNETLSVISDGANWQILNRFIPANVITFTPTGSWSTNTTYTGKYYRIGQEIDVWIRISLSGAPNSAVLTVNIPNSATWTINTSNIPGGNSLNVTSGDCFLQENTGGTGFGRIPCSVVGNTTTSVTLMSFTGGTDKFSTQMDQANPITFANLDTVTLRYRIPITGLNAWP